MTAEPLDLLGCAEQPPLKVEQRQAAALRIVIEPTKSGLKWIARLGDRVLCSAAAPFVTSARLLLAKGYPAAAVIEMWWPNSQEWALRGRLGAVAATLMDGEKASRCAKNGSPVRENGTTQYPFTQDTSVSRCGS